MNDYMIGWTIWCAMLLIGVVCIHFAFQPAFRRQAEDHARRREALVEQRKRIAALEASNRAWRERQAQRMADEDDL